MMDICDRFDEPDDIGNSVIDVVDTVKASTYIDKDSEDASFPTKQKSITGFTKLIASCSDMVDVQHSSFSLDKTCGSSAMSKAFSQVWATTTYHETTLNARITACMAADEYSPVRELYPYRSLSSFRTRVLINALAGIVDHPGGLNARVSCQLLGSLAESSIDQTGPHPPGKRRCLFGSINSSYGTFKRPAKHFDPLPKFTTSNNDSQNHFSCSGQVSLSSSRKRKLCRVSSGAYKLVMDADSLATIDANVVSTAGAGATTERTTPMSGTEEEDGRSMLREIRIAARDLDPDNLHARKTADIVKPPDPDQGCSGLFVDNSLASQVLISPRTSEDIYNASDPEQRIEEEETRIMTDKGFERPVTPAGRNRTFRGIILPLGTESGSSSEEKAESKGEFADTDTMDHDSDLYPPWPHAIVLRYSHHMLEVRCPYCGDMESFRLSLRAMTSHEQFRREVGSTRLALCEDHDLPYRLAFPGDASDPSLEVRDLGWQLIRRESDSCYEAVGLIIQDDRIGDLSGHYDTSLDVPLDTVCTFDDEADELDRMGQGEELISTQKMDGRMGLQLGNQDIYTYSCGRSETRLDTFLRSDTETKNNVSIRISLDERRDVRKGNTELALAANEGNLQRCREHILNGSDVNAMSNDGWTPLMYATKACCIPLVVLLLSCGCDRGLRNNQGHTAKMLADCVHSKRTKNVNVGYEMLIDAQKYRRRLVSILLGHEPVRPSSRSHGTSTQAYSEDPDDHLIISGGDDRRRVRYMATALRTATRHLHFKKSIGILLRGEQYPPITTVSGYETASPFPESSTHLRNKVSSRHVRGLANFLGYQFKPHGWDNAHVEGAYLSGHVEPQLMVSFLLRHHFVRLNTDYSTASDEVVAKLETIKPGNSLNHATIMIDKPACKSCIEFKEFLEEKYHVVFSFKTMSSIKTTSDRRGYSDFSNWNKVMRKRPDAPVPRIESVLAPLGREIDRRMAAEQSDDYTEDQPGSEYESPDQHTTKCPPRTPTTPINTQKWPTIPHTTSHSAEEPLLSTTAKNHAIPPWTPMTQKESAKDQNTVQTILAADPITPPDSNSHPSLTDDLPTATTQPTPTPNPDRKKRLKLKKQKKRLLKAAKLNHQKPKSSVNGVSQESKRRPGSTDVSPFHTPLKTSAYTKRERGDGTQLGPSTSTHPSNRHNLLEASRLLQISQCTSQPASDESVAIIRFGNTSEEAIELSSDEELEGKGGLGEQEEEEEEEIDGQSIGSVWSHVGSKLGVGDKSKRREERREKRRINSSLDIGSSSANDDCARWVSATRKGPMTRGSRGCGWDVGDV